MDSSAETPSLAPALAPPSPVAPSNLPAIGDDRLDIASPDVPAASGSVASPSIPVPEAAPTPSALKDDMTATVSLQAPAPDSTNDAPPVSLEQTNDQQSSTKQPIPQTPQIYLTFLLLSGHRRTMNFEPATGIGRVKEVVWGGWSGGDWPAEDKPPAPSYLRVLHAGRMLQDDETLANLKLPIYTPPAVGSSESTLQPQPPTTIMHISVRPFGSGAEDIESGSVKKSSGRRGRRRDGTTTSDGDAIEEPRSGCCGCVIC